jgi:hypothetical protein
VPWIALTHQFPPIDKPAQNLIIERFLKNKAFQEADENSPIATAEAWQLVQRTFPSQAYIVFAGC